MFPAMILYLLLVLIRPQDYPEMADRIGLPLLPIALLIAAMFWLPSQRKSFEAPQYALLLAFFATMLFSHVFNGWFGGALEQLQKFAPVLLAFVVFSHALDRRERLLKAMAAFAICGAVLSLHGIEQVELGVGWTGVGLSQETRIQYVGIFNDPNDLGMLFVICVPMAAYLSGRGGLLGLRRLFWLAIAAILIYGIYLTDSRGSLLALLVVMGVYVWQTRGLFVAGALGACAVGVLLALPSRFQEIDASEASAQGRVESWYEGLQMFREYPLFGVGPDMYTEHHPLTAHNSFVLVLAETGIVGFAIWLAFVAYGFRMMWAGSRPHEAWDDDAPGLGQETGGDRMSAQALVAATGHAPVGDAPRPFAADAHAVGTRAIEGRFDDGACDAADETADARAREGRAIAMTLLLSLIGCFTAAFFLSRSYVVVIYLLAAMAVAHYADLRRDDPALPLFELGREFLRWPVIAVGAVVGLYLMVKVLLAFQ